MLPVSQYCVYICQYNELIKHVCCVRALLAKLVIVIDLGKHLAMNYLTVFFQWVIVPQTGKTLDNAT